MAILETWNYKEIERFYDRVRKLLNDLSEVSLPNADIDLPEKAPYAEYYCKSKVKNWQDLDEMKFMLFQSAIIYKTASMFESIISSNKIRKKQLQTITLEYFQDDKPNNSLSLSEMADQLLNDVLGNKITPFNFVVSR